MFSVSRKLIEDMMVKNTISNKLFKNMVVIDATTDFSSDSIIYTVYYKHAEIVPPGKLPPIVTLSIDKKWKVIID